MSDVLVEVLVYETSPGERDKEWAVFARNGKVARVDRAPWQPQPPCSLFPSFRIDKKGRVTRTH